jgi:CheY-like chemotaxis protein
MKTHGLDEPGRYALISMTDTGIGLDEMARQRIFEPFFTTKEIGKGTGLGLAIVYGIIKQHNGYITVYSEPEKGTTFNIYLPLIESPVEKASMKEVIAPIGGTETILLTEDNDEVRALITHVLQELGYTVIEAVDGEDAISKFEENKARIALAILDIIMPKKSGKEASDAIKNIKPDAKVLFISGYTADIITKVGINEEGEYFIQKPISPQSLLDKVREILDKKG